MSETATIAHCVKVTRRDGIVIGFTDHDVDLVLSGVTYRSVVSVDLSAIETQAGLNVDNLGLLGISQSDIVAGRWDFADAHVFAVNVTNLSVGTLKLRHGWLACTCRWLGRKQKRAHGGDARVS